MKLYRAIPKNPSQSVSRMDIAGVPTRRVPSNVPYLVDNVWEFLRPDGAPSRRHAAYASPTPELALKNASAFPGADYEVWEVLLQPAESIVICSVPDAREHADIKKVPAVFTQALRPELCLLPFEQTQHLAPLYMPALAKDDLRAFFDKHPDLAQLAKETSRFWQDAQLLKVSALHAAEHLADNSEIFFSARHGYQMIRL